MNTVIASECIWLHMHCIAATPGPSFTAGCGILSIAGHTDASTATGHFIRLKHFILMCGMDCCWMLTIYRKGPVPLCIRQKYISMATVKPVAGQ